MNVSACLHWFSSHSGQDIAEKSASYYSAIYSVQIKSATFNSLFITSANVDRFSNFLHWQIPKEILYATVSETSSSPELRC